MKPGFIARKEGEEEVIEGGIAAQANIPYYLLAFPNDWAHLCRLGRNLVEKIDNDIPCPAHILLF